MKIRLHTQKLKIIPCCTILYHICIDYVTNWSVPYITATYKHSRSKQSMKIHLDRPASMTEQASVAFNFTHNIGAVTVFWEAKSHSGLGICYGMVSERLWIFVWIWRERKGGAGVVNVPCGQSVVCVHAWSVPGLAWSGMTDELAVDLGGLGDSLSVCDSRGALCALTPPRAVIEFTIPHHSSAIYGSQVNKWQNHEIPTVIVARTLWAILS